MVRGELSLQPRGFDGSPVGWRSPAVIAVEAAPEAATLLWSCPLSDMSIRMHEGYIDARLVATNSVVATGGGGSAGPIERRAALFLTEPKACALVDAGLDAAVSAEDGDAVGSSGLVVRLRAKAPAFYVALSAEGLDGRFDDAGFHMAAGEERLVRVVPEAVIPTLAGDPRLAGESRQRAGGAPGVAELSTALRAYDLRSSYE